MEQQRATGETLVAKGIRIDGLKLETPNLETVFLSLTGRALRDGGGAA